MLHDLLVLQVFFNCVLLVVLLGAERTMAILQILPVPQMLLTLMTLSFAPQPPQRQPSSPG
jgi:hypothetical protein